MTSASPIPGIILAGGQSRRMGRDKSFLEVDGKPVILRVAEALRDACPEIMIVGRTSGRYLSLGISCYPDVVPQRGPLGGIYTALQRACTDVVIVACDLPFVSARLIRFIVTRHQSDGASVTVVRSRYEIQPLLGVYGFSCLPLLSDCLQKGEQRVQSFLRECNAHILSVESASPPFDPEVLFNLNDPKAYSAIAR